MCKLFEYKFYAHPVFYCFFKLLHFAVLCDINLDNIKNKNYHFETQYLCAVIMYFQSCLISLQLKIFLIKKDLIIFCFFQGVEPDLQTVSLVIVIILESNPELHPKKVNFTAPTAGTKPVKIKFDKPEPELELSFKRFRFNPLI